MSISSWSTGRGRDLTTMTDPNPRNRLLREEFPGRQIVGVVRSTIERKSAPCRVPNVPLYDVTRREAKNASAIPDGAKWTSNEPCRHAGIRPARRPPPTPSDDVSQTIQHKAERK